MHIELFEKTAKLEEVLSYKQQHTVWYQNAYQTQKFQMFLMQPQVSPLYWKQQNKLKNMTQKTAK